MFIDPFIPSLIDELIKIGSVRGPVKQYRRMRTGFEQASRSMKGDPHQVARDGLALHGTDDLKGILDAGHILPSPAGEHGQHGPGVYWWKGFPRESNLRGLQDEGVATSLRELPNKLPQVRNAKSGHFNLHAQRSGPGPYQLKPKDTAIMDIATRSQNNTLAPMLADAAERRARVVDTGLFHRARQSQMAANAFASTGGKGQVPVFPTKPQLMQLHANRMAGHLT